MRRNQELFILTSQKDENTEGGEEEWSGIISKIGDYLKEETKKIKKMFETKLSRFDDYNFRNED